MSDNKNIGWATLLKKSIEQKHLIEASEWTSLLDAAESLLKQQSTLIRVDGQVRVVGDIHGDADALIHWLNGRKEGEHLLMLGDYVDRGSESALCWQIVLLLKLCYADRVHLLRGNHECSKVSEIYGFKEDLIERYGKEAAEPLFARSAQVFCSLSLAAVVNGSVLAMHAGLSPHISTLADIEAIDRFCPVQPAGAMTDLLWSDPSPDEGFVESKRGCSFQFGPDVTAKFLAANAGLSLIVRSHALVNAGHEYTHADNSVLTIFSVPNYCGTCKNDASIAVFSPCNAEPILEHLKSQ